MASSGSSSGGGNVINPNNAVELDEVIISVVINRTNVGISDVSWFFGTTLNGIQRNSNYHAENFTARYSTRDLHRNQITSQTRSQMARYARNAKRGGIVATVIFGVWDISDGYSQDGGQIGRNTKAAMARTGGGAAGAYAGGKIGAFVGFALCGPPCSLAGGILVAAYGGYQGSKQAEKLVN